MRIVVGHYRLAFLSAIAAILVGIVAFDLAQPYLDVWRAARQREVAQHEAQQSRKRRHQAAMRQTRELPPVDKVVVGLLGTTTTSTASILIRPYKETVAFLNPVTLLGDEAEKVAAVWRTRGFEGSGAFCHFPVFGIRFYRYDNLLFETTLCWQCQNFFVYDDSGNSAWQGFSDPGRELFQLLDSIRPLPKPTVNNDKAANANR